MNRILIIEDDISINKILSHELKNKDYQVDSLYDGKEACQKILQDAYKNSLKIAKKKGIKSIAFPLISSGIYGYPDKDAFMIAKNTIDEFLKNYEMEVYLSTYGKNILSLIMG